TRFSRDWSSDVCSSDLHFGLALSGLSPDPSAAQPYPLIPMVAMLAVFILTTMTAMGLYDSEVREAVGMTLLRLLLAFVLGLVLEIGRASCRDMWWGVGG